MMRLILVGLFASLAYPIAGRAQSTAAADGPRLAPTQFQAMDFPETARRAATQGVVVIEATLDERGGVAQAAALSGVPELTTPALENARRWAFPPNRQTRAVIVYDFRLLDSCRMTSSVFTISDTGLAVVAACAPGSAVRPSPGQLELLSFGGILMYPPIAISARVQGVVVVAVTLDDKGFVATSSLLSGEPVLIREALQDVMTWRFKPGPTHGVIVYDFRLEGSCHIARTAFQILHDNMAAVTSCQRLGVQILIVPSAK